MSINKVLLELCIKHLLFDNANIILFFNNVIFKVLFYKILLKVLKVFFLKKEITISYNINMTIK